MNLKSELSKIVGAQYVDDGSKTLSAYSKDNSLMEAGGMPDILVKPENAEQVQKIVQYANEVKIPIIPVSSKVHFHGSTLLIS